MSNSLDTAVCTALLAIDLRRTLLAIGTTVMDALLHLFAEFTAVTTGTFAPEAIMIRPLRLGLSKSLELFKKIFRIYAAI